MNYWLNLFTGETWDDFRQSGSQITGFRASRQRMVSRIQSGDLCLCYLTGVMRWVGALKVVGPSKDTSPIFKLDDFPARLEVKTLVALTPEHGIPMENFEGKLAFYDGPRHRGKFDGFLRGSPSLFKRPADGELILKALRQAESDPIVTAFDPRKLAKKPLYMAALKKGRATVETLVSVPEPDDDETSAPESRVEGDAVGGTRHAEIQYHLLKLGNEMGLDVWIAKNDRTKSFNGEVLGALPGMLAELPTQFNEATHRTIEMIDVLWLKEKTIVAAFEVECTTSIYSGLLRMSDLLALQPNLDIKLYLVAPDDRRRKVEQEIRRPTFAIGDRPLPRLCGFLSFSNLVEKFEGIRRLGLAGALKPEFLTGAAEYFLEG